MEFIHQLIDFILHIDQHLEAIIAQYGTLTYIILFLIIFAETGFVVTPFLPGDSLLFAVGAIAALGAINVWLVLILVLIAAFTGNMVNYSIGRQMSERIFKAEKIRFIKRSNTLSKRRSSIPNMGQRQWLSDVSCPSSEPLFRLLRASV